MKSHKRDLKNEAVKIFFAGIALFFITGCAQTPTVITSNVTSIKTNSVSCGGNVTADGGAAVTMRGVCWSTTPDPDIVHSKTNDGSGTGSFESNLTGLTASSTYYIKAYASNRKGTAYGNEVTFKTNPDGVTDIDGNFYPILILGDQTWMAQNLKVTKYNDGINAIPMIGEDNTAWTSTKDPAYCWFQNDEAANKPSYGALYNWYAVNTGKLCPTGWHVPTEAEWGALITYLTDHGFGFEGNGSDIAKSMAAQSGWLDFSTRGMPGNDQAGNNSSGFTGLPGGHRSCSDGKFYVRGERSPWWSSTSYNNQSSALAWRYGLYHNLDFLTKISLEKNFGFGVRCIKDI